MADRYTLPAELGGGEVDLVSVSADLAEVRLAAGYMIELPFSALTPVKPPLPPEPPDGSVVRAGNVVTERSDTPFDDGDQRWACTTLRPSRYSWRELCEIAAAAEPAGVPVVLVPDPFGEPVQLPWRHVETVNYDSANSEPTHTQETSVAITAFGDLNEVVDVNRCGSMTVAVHLDPAAARAKARALWIAADQVEVDDAPRRLTRLSRERQAHNDYTRIERVLDERRRRYVEWVVEQERQVRVAGIRDFRAPHGPAPDPPEEIAPVGSVTRICRYCHEDWPCSTATQAEKASET